MRSITKKYIPNVLTKKDYTKQKKNIRKSRKLYKKGIYIDRPKLKSFPKKESPHIAKAKKMYGVDKIVPSKSLAKTSKCSVKGLRRITKKGRGAYYSSGSRPNQTAQSWARARLASTLTGGPASKYDYHILREECEPNSKALKLAMKK